MRVDFPAFGIDQPVLIVSHFHLAAFRWITFRYNANNTVVKRPALCLGLVRRHLEHICSIRGEGDRIRMTAFSRGSVQFLAGERTLDLLII